MAQPLEHTVSNVPRGKRNNLLRLDVATFMPSEPSESAKSISLSKCLKTRTIALFISFFKWTSRNN